MTCYASTSMMDDKIWQQILSKCFQIEGGQNAGCISVYRSYVTSLVQFTLMIIFGGMPIDPLNRC